MNSVTEDPTGVSQSAALFSGVNSKVTVPATAVGRIVGDITISLWIKPTGANENPDDVSVLLSNKPTWDAIEGFELQYLAGKKFLRLIGSTGSFCEAQNVEIEANRWHHIIAIADGAKCHILVDGNDLTTNNVIRIIQPSAQILRIGNDIDGYAPFLGSIDELYIINGFLLPTRLQGAINANPSCIVAPVVTTGATGTTGIASTTGISYITTSTGNVVTTDSTTGPRTTELGISSGNRDQLSSDAVRYQVCFFFVIIAGLFSRFCQFLI